MFQTVISTSLLDLVYSSNKVENSGLGCTRIKKKVKIYNKKNFYFLRGYPSSQKQQRILQGDKEFYWDWTRKSRNSTHMWTKDAQQENCIIRLGYVNGWNSSWKGIYKQECRKVECANGNEGYYWSDRIDRQTEAYLSRIRKDFWRRQPIFPNGTMMSTVHLAHSPTVSLKQRSLNPQALNCYKLTRTMYMMHLSKEREKRKKN